MADREFSLYMQDLLMRFDTLNLAGGQVEAGSFDHAFQQAREADTDYFLLFNYNETERSFRVECALYLTRTGSFIREFSVYRTGNNRVKEGLLRISGQIHESFSLKGKILAREFDTGIIDLGTAQRIDKDMEFLIIKKGSLKFRSDEIGFLYREEDILGHFLVSGTDENLSEGKIQPISFFDRINPGDEVILAPAAK